MHREFYISRGHYMFFAVKKRLLIYKLIFIQAQIGKRDTKGVTFCLILIFFSGETYILEITRYLG